MVSWKKGLLAVGILILILALISGCDDPDEKEVEEEVEDVEEEKEVVIGFSGPLSGPAAEYGEDNRDGMDMAINDINEAGGINVDGINYTLRLESLDDQADPTQAVTNAERLKDSYNVPAVYNPVATAITPTLGINEEEGHEFIMMAYTSTPLELEIDNDLVMYIPPSFTSWVQHLSTWAWEEGWRDAAMLVTAGAYGDGWREAFELFWEDELGGNVVADHPANYYEQTDFSTEVTSIMDAGADVILIGGPSAPTGLAVEQAREMGYEGGFIMIDQAKVNYLEEVLDGLDLLDGMICLGPPAQAHTPSAVEFDERLAAEYQPTAVTFEHSNAYAATILLAKAMEEAGSVEDPYAIREAIPDTLPLLDGDVDYPLVLEYYGIHDTGRLLYPINNVMVRDGEYDEMQSIVWAAESQEEFEEIVSMLTIDPERGEDYFNYLWFEEYGIFEPYD